MKGVLSWVVPKSGRQAFCFALIYVSYMCFYFDRKNYSFWLNELVSKEGKRKEDVSLFGSVMESSYGLGKLIAGPLVDSAPPSIVLYGTLAIASLCNVLIFQTESLALNTSLWAVNGIVQSAAWPALAAIFMNWFAESPNRGIWYSVLSTNQNLGSALIPVILAPLVDLYGWRAAVMGPGVIGICFAAVLVVFLQEFPDDHYASEPVVEDVKKSEGVSTSKKGESWLDKMREMLTSVNLLSLGVGYAFLTTIRVGVQDWSFVILQESRKVSMEVARDCVVMLEVGGFLGGISAGAISDRMFGGRRGPVLVAFTGLLAPVLVGIVSLPLPEDNLHMALVCLYFAFGFVSFGPHMLVGLTAREVFPQAPSTAGAFTKSLAQVGGTLAGYPLSLVIQSYGWGQIGFVWASCAVLGALSFAPLLVLPPYSPSTGKKPKAD